jgi:hypothetical protein
MAIDVARRLTGSSKADADSPLMEAGLDSLLMPTFTEVAGGESNHDNLLRDTPTRFLAGAGWTA